MKEIRPCCSHGCDRPRHPPDVPRLTGRPWSPSALESLDSRIVPSGNPHFIKNLVTSTVNDAGALVVDFKESGLPSRAVETITLSTTASATYAYINNGGNHPKADNKESVVAQLSTSGQFTADQNGN